MPRMRVLLAVSAWITAKSLQIPIAAPRPVSIYSRCPAAVACDCPSADDLNFLQTHLYQAVSHEDYRAAATYRDRILAMVGQKPNDSYDWRSFGVPEWLCDRLQRIGFHMPTRVQLNALQAMGNEGRDAAICAATGSGKTLAYLVPALARLSSELMQVLR